MRHRKSGRKLGRTSEHRMAMLRNMSSSLFTNERIKTTLAKAKALRPYAERLVTLSKRETLHARRQVLRSIPDRKVVAKLFDSLAARYAQRPGGYTRIIKLGPRRGDNAEMAIIELVDSSTDEGAGDNS
ncbi:MAG: 50S ribosomal protein L17 [Acidobacteriota bacterium]|nr:50S ribosomal protein L17 [Acidobacteriota bacterium]MDH3786760.1 50S ribosomal protein L17 [Acidobacteriota bacterium]